MATIITKNSTTPGSIPGTIVQGELAINTADGKLFYGSGSVAKEYSASLATTASYITGSVFNSTNPALSASYALTASYVQNITAAGNNYEIQFNSASVASGSDNFTFDYNTNTATLIGSLIVSESLNSANRSLINSSGLTAVDWENSQLFIPIGVDVLNWSTQLLRDTNNIIVLDWQNKQLFDASAILSQDWTGRYLVDNTGEQLSLDWNNRQAVTTAGIPSIDWEQFSLTDGALVQSVDWDNRIAYDKSNLTSIDWFRRRAYDGTGTTVSIDWDARIARSSNLSSSIDWNNRRLIGTNGTTTLLDWNSSSSATLTGTASWAISASWAPSTGGTPGGANTTIQFNDSNTFSGSGNFTFTKATNTVKLSGSLNLTGSLLATQSYISKIDYIDYTVSPGTLAHSEGRTYWDVDRKTLQIDTDVNNFTISAGHVSVLRGRNTNSYTLTKGMVVYINGNSGQFATFTTASWENDPNSAYTIGLIAQDINANQFGYAVTDGEITGVNTNAFAPATLLYLSSSGQYTDTKPVAPNHTVRLGQVVVSSTNGILQVKIDNGYELGELHDVIDNTTTSSYGDLLVKSGSVWHNSRQLTGSYAITGSLEATSFTGSLQGTSSWAVSASQALTASFVPNSFATDIGNGILTTINVTHGLGTRDVHVTVYSASGDFATVICDVYRSSSLNDIRLVFANAPATNEYRVVVSK